MDKYILITGSNGYLGRYLCTYALNMGYKVIGFSFPHWASQKIEHPNIQYIDVDVSLPIEDVKLIDELSQKNIIGIINAAALLGSSDIDKNRAVNAQGVQHMIDLAHQLNVKKFVQISSVVILKAIQGPYGITKKEGQEFLTKSDLDWTVFIPAMILGPESLGINRVLKNVFRIPFIVPLIGSGKQTQHPIFVKDFAEYIVKAVVSDNTNKKIYQIASDSVIPFKSLIKMILDVSGKKKVFIPIPVWFAKLLGSFFQATQKVPVFTAEHVKGIMQDSNLDTSALQKDLNFKPTPLKEALTYTLNTIDGGWDFYLNPREEKKIKLS